MLRQELNTYQKQQQLEKNRRDFNSRINQILNNQNHHQILPTTNEVEIIEKVIAFFSFVNGEKTETVLGAKPELIQKLFDKTETHCLFG